MPTPEIMKKSIRRFAIIICVALCGCSFFAARKHRVETKQDERVREVVQAATVANQVGRERLQSKETNSIAEAMIAYDLSATFLKRGQTIVGLPVVDQSQEVADLLSSNRALKESAEARERARVAQEQGWAAERAALLLKLQEMGAKYEAEKNKSVLHRVWGWLTGLIGVGGVIALMVFCPALIPVFGRILAWVVSMFPKLAGVIGVVSTKAFDGVVRGIHRAKGEMSTNDSNPAEALDTNLSREMDRSHKDLVQARLPIAQKEIALRAAAA
jgi:hypothetical protein